MNQTIYLFNGVEVVLTGRQAVKQGKTGNIIQTIVEIKPVNTTIIDWTYWTPTSEMFVLLEGDNK